METFESGRYHTDKPVHDPPILTVHICRSPGQLCPAFPLDGRIHLTCGMMFLFLLFKCHIGYPSMSFAYPALKKLFCEIKGGLANTPEDRDRVQQDLNTMEKWANENKMQFNKDKCKVLHLGQKNEKHAYWMGDTLLAFPIVFGAFCMPLAFLRGIPRKLLQVQPSINLRSRAFMDLKVLVSLLNDFASLSLAESWDNVGLLVEPSPPHVVSTLFLTNDLTEEVMEEALQERAGLILSYHPPIFKPLKRITWQTWKERLVIRALENRVGVYSPHTAYDAAPHGVNTWLAKALGACTTIPLHPSAAPNYPTKGCYRIEFSSCSAEAVLSRLREMPGVSLLTTVPARVDGAEQVQVSLNCTQSALLQVMALLSQSSPVYEKTEIISLQKFGICAFAEPAMETNSQAMYI
ncbi:NIF3-like protein 1 isoform X2 [Paroedura picta]|uniref:NIF3-like protein 1 isoform X2 n=1 Tax=Paroedura picta TaxID=143630 RepID=UPI004056E5CA